MRYIAAARSGASLPTLDVMSEVMRFFGRSAVAQSGFLNWLHERHFVTTLTERILLSFQKSIVRRICQRTSCNRFVTFAG